ncbi:hypothetical protein MNV49_007526 [Pseudohyphozyma bogoriensis]|nr:hypothetical protein MNV49_007526 [Pseudohyphozyma bogoriensis]
MSSTNTTIPAYRPFDIIPNEVLLRILSSSLPRSTLLSLTRVSARFREAATIALYDSISVNWEYKPAAKLAKEFEARPQLYALVHTISVEFTNPAWLDDRVRDHWREFPERSYELDEVLERIWKERVGVASQTWETDYAAYVEYIHPREPMSREEYDEGELRDTWFDFLNDDEVTEILVERYLSTPEHSWLSAEDHVRGMEAFAAFVMRMENLTGLHISQGGELDFGSQAPALRAFSKRLRSVTLDAGGGGLAVLLDLLDGGELRELYINSTTPLQQSLFAFPTLQRLRILDYSMDFDDARTADLTRLLLSARTIRFLSINPLILYRVLESNPSFKFENLQHLVLEDVGHPVLPDNAWTPGSPLSRLISSSHVTALEFKASFLESSESLLDNIPFNIETLSIQVLRSFVDEVVRRVLGRLEGSEPDSRFLSCVKVLIAPSIFGEPLEVKAFDGKGRVFVERDEGKTWEERQRCWEF